LARANGQAATGALINNEQFALGGINSVRGYYEGDDYGDRGWSGSLELRSPFFQTRVAGLTRSVPAWLRASVFTDFGQGFLMEPAGDGVSHRSLWGTGFGLSANINNHADARMVIAWPLVQSANTVRGEPRAYFTIGCQF
jgi:hemolysin activation/secretion protein